MMTETTIRPARRTDLDAIAGFQHAMARETEGKELDPETVKGGVQAVFADHRRGRYLVAERGTRVVGSLMLTTEWSDWRNGDFWWIQSVFVERESRRKGVYRALQDRVFSEARAADGVCGVRLYVERENTPAQAVYETLGMTRTSYLFYEVDFPQGR
jgi:ribosomal protein S18 acetylase RimI-like enzyme